MTSSDSYVLVKDIVIPAGTRLYLGPNKTTYFAPHLEASVGLSPSTTATIVISLKDALEDGVIERGTG